MYQFTREFIINDNKGKLPGGVKFYVNTDSNTLMVDHMCNIRKQDVAHIYKNAGDEEKIEKVTLKPSATVAKDDIIRLVITLSLENRVHPLFNDYYPDHTQTFIYEAKATGTTLPIQDLVDAMTEERNRFENLYFTAEVNSGNIELTLMDCYTRLEAVRLVKVPADHSGNANLAAQLTGYQDYEVLGNFDFKNRKAILDEANKTSGTPVISFNPQGSAGVNTTNYIVQNMRLLTDANINPYGVNMDERPLPKSVYDQYTIEMVTERRHIGHQVMGAIDHSLTTIIFFVLNNKIDDTKTVTDQTKSVNPSAAFEAFLKKIGTVEAAYKNPLPTNEEKATATNIGKYVSPIENVVPTKADLVAGLAGKADATSGQSTTTGKAVKA